MKIFIRDDFVRKLSAVGRFQTEVEDQGNYSVTTHFNFILIILFLQWSY